MTAPGLYAVLFLDNWDGEGDVYHMLAELLDSGKWVDHRSGRELLEYEGDSILKVWPLNDDKATQVPPRDMLMRVARSVRAACFEACNENGGDWAAIASLDLADVISDAMAEIIGELGTTEIAGHGNNQVEPISVPAGWKLVPIEPTSKMIVAGSETDPQFFAHAQFVYRAMLAAAPTQEGGA